MAEPVGLGMSLDDLISKQREQQEAGYGKQRRSGPGRQGGDRGGRGRGGRGRGEHRMQEDWQGGPRQQQHFQQPRGQWQQQQQYGQQQRGPGRGRGQGYDTRQRDPNAYRQHQKCFQTDGGDVVFRFMQARTRQGLGPAVLGGCSGSVAACRRPTSRCPQCQGHLLLAGRGFRRGAGRTNRLLTSLPSPTPALAAAD